MGTNDFQIGLVGKLDANQSKQQLNSDIDALKKQLNTVEVQAQLGKDVVSKLTQQLNATQFTINNVKVDQTAINNMISQFNTAFSKVNINLGNINTNGATQSAQKTGQQIGNQLGNSINQSLQANLNHVKQDIQNIFSSFSVQKLNNADIFKNFNLNRAKIDPSVTKDVQSLTAEINKLAREALKTNSDSAWEGITQKISNLSDVLNKFGATRDLSGFKEQMDLLDYFQGKKIFVGDKAEAIQNTGMSIRELNNQFRNLGVTFTTVENGSTKLDEIWSELFNIKPSFQGIDSFGGQINAVVNELKIAKEAMYGDSNLMPAQRTGATTTYLNAWLEMLEKLSQRIEILKTEQANLQNQMAQASNNATNAVVANQQKQQQAYQQTGSVIQAVTSNTSVIGNMPKEASDIGDAKNQLSQLLQNEKAVIATTQHFDNDGMMRTFTLNVKRATGEVESLNYAFRQVTDNNGNVTDTYFENTSSHLNDSGAIKQIDAIEEAFSDYTTEIAKFKSTNAEILSGLDTPLKDFETKLAGLKTGASTVNEVKSAFNSLNTEAAKITQNFSKQLSPIDRAVSKIANGEETIKGLHAELKGLDNTPKDLSTIVNTLPSVDAADEHTIYMVPKASGAVGSGTNNGYDEYMLIVSGSTKKFEKIGDSAVDLTNYATKAYADQSEADALSAAKTYANGLAKNYATAAQGIKADSAVQSVKIGTKEYKSGTTVTLPSYPTTLPASDVYAWAKASEKPTYTKSEVGLGNVDNTADANKSVKYATSAGSAKSATTATTASKLGTNAGSTTHPVYFANGVPVEANVSSDFLVQGSNTIVFDCGNASA